MVSCLADAQFPSISCATSHLATHSVNAPLHYNWTALYGGAGREQVVDGAGGVEAQLVERGGEFLAPLVAERAVEVVVVEDVVQDGAPLEHGGVAVYERWHLAVGVGRQELLGLVRPAFSFFLSTPLKY